MVSSSMPTRMRTQGVVGSSPEEINAPVRTLTNCVPVQMFAAEWGDESGKRVREFVFKVNDAIYIDPNGEQWAAQLRTVPKTSWLYRQLMDAAASQEKVVDVPKEDVVDVTGAKR